MPEPIFSNDPFDPPSIDELLATLPPEAKAGLQLARAMRREARNEQCPCPIHSPSEFEFDVQTLAIGSQGTDNLIQDKINAGWSPDILGAHDGYILFMFSRKKPCTEES